MEKFKVHFFNLISIPQLKESSRSEFVERVTQIKNQTVDWNCLKMQIFLDSYGSYDGNQGTLRIEVFLKKKLVLKPRDLLKSLGSGNKKVITHSNNPKTL